MRKLTAIFDQTLSQGRPTICGEIVVIHTNSFPSCANHFLQANDKGLLTSLSQIFPQHSAQSSSCLIVGSGDIPLLLPDYVRLGTQLCFLDFDPLLLRFMKWTIETMTECDTLSQFQHAFINDKSNPCRDEIDALIPLVGDRVITKEEKLERYFLMNYVSKERYSRLLDPETFRQIHQAATQLKDVQFVQIDLTAEPDRKQLSSIYDKLGTVNCINVTNLRQLLQINQNKKALKNVDITLQYLSRGSSPSVLYAEHFTSMHVSAYSLLPDAPKPDSKCVLL